MQDLIWKVKQLFRKIIPIVLIVGICYGGFTAYKKGWFGKKVTQQVAAWTHKIPFFGSKFVPTFLSSNSRSDGSRVSQRLSRTSSYRKHSGKRHRGHRRHSRHSRYR